MAAEIAADELRLAHECAERAERGYAELGAAATAERAAVGAEWSDERGAT